MKREVCKREQLKETEKYIFETRETVFKSLLGNSFKIPEKKLTENLQQIFLNVQKLILELYFHKKVSEVLKKCWKFQQRR